MEEASTPSLMRQAAASQSRPVRDEIANERCQHVMHRARTKLLGSGSKHAHTASTGVVSESQPMGTIDALRELHKETAPELDNTP